MKKIFKKFFVIFIVCIFSIQTSFGYELNKKDEKILNKIYKILDKKFYKKENAKKLYLKIKKIKPKFLVSKNNRKYRKKIRIYFLLDAIEKYLEKKNGIGTNKKSGSNYIKNNFINSGNNLVKSENILKIKNEQDEEIAKEVKNINKKKKKIFKLIKNNFKKSKKNNDKKIIKTEIKNGVLIKYVKKEKKYIPKNTPKNIVSKKQEKFLVKKIALLKNKNFIVVKYYKTNKIFEISGLENYSCNGLKLNNFLKNNLEGKKVIFENIKKINSKKLKAEFYLSGENLAKKIIENNICKK